MNQLYKQVAIVTGGARRIGAALVHKFHEAGYKVLIHCSNSKIEAQALCDFLNQKKKDSALVCAIDLLNPEAPGEMTQIVMDWAGRIDVLVNNASVFYPSSMNNSPEDDWSRLWSTNVKAPYLLSLASYPFLAENEGVIINITDMHAQKPLRGYSVYCQTKAALEMQTKSLAVELAPKVRVNAVAPGAIAWPEKQNALTEAQKKKIIEKTPLKKHGHPDYIAQAVVSLVHNPFITGQIIQVDGGRGL